MKRTGRCPTGARKLTASHLAQDDVSRVASALSLCDPTYPGRVARLRRRLGAMQDQARSSARTLRDHDAECETCTSALDVADAKLHRCTGCGAWLYAERPCSTGCPPVVTVARDAA